MGGINTNRVLLGGVVAGIVGIASSWVFHGVVLMGRYAIAQKAGLLFAKPQLGFMPVYMVALLGQGILLAFLYAAARPRLGAGPKTAVAVGLVTAFIGGLPAYAQAAWSPVGRFVALMQLLDVVVACVGGALVAGALYKES